MVEVDDSEFPFVTVRFVDSNTDEEFDAYLDALDRIRADAKRRYVVMFDATRARAPSGRQARVQAQWLRSRSRAIQRTTIANAFVIQSPGMAAALKAIFTLTSAVIPYAVVATRHEARAVLLRYLERDAEESVA